MSNKIKLYSHRIAAIVKILIFKKDSCFSLDMPKKNGLYNTVEPILLESVKLKNIGNITYKYTLTSNT